jgi:hypothetical protein
VYGSPQRPPLGIVGDKRIEVDIEYSSPDLMDSDFSFTQAKALATWRIPTLFRRRLMPMTLDISLAGSVSDGDLPLQRFGTVDGAMGFFSAFGALRSLRYHPLVGEQTCAVCVEHNFRTVPFELLHIGWLVDRNYGIIAHGAVGRAWISRGRLAELPSAPYYRDGWQSEAGVSLNGLFGIFRADLTKRLDRHGWFAGIGVTRYF